MADSELMRAAALRPDGLAEEAVLHVATYLEHAERASALYLLTLAAGDLEPWQRRRLDELHRLVQASLAHPELTGREAVNVAERRRIEAIRLLTLATHRDRLVHAPIAFLLGREPDDLARQAALMEPLPHVPAVRAAGHLDTGLPPSGTWPAGTGGDCWPSWRECSRRRASTWWTPPWPPGVTAARWNPSRCRRPRRSTPTASGGPSSRRSGRDWPPTPIPGASIAFDDEGSPWYTLCEVEAPDRPGLLSSLAGALAVSGADIHSARVVADSGVARARFELTDGRGEKLRPSAKEGIRTAVVEGVRRQLPVRSRSARLEERRQPASS